MHRYLSIYSHGKNRLTFFNMKISKKIPGEEEYVGDKSRSKYY